MPQCRPHGTHFKATCAHLLQWHDWQEDWCNVTSILGQGSHSSYFFWKDLWSCADRKDELWCFKCWGLVGIVGHWVPTLVLENLDAAARFLYSHSGPFPPAFLSCFIPTLPVCPSTAFCQEHSLWLFLVHPSLSLRFSPLSFKHSQLGTETQQKPFVRGSLTPGRFWKQLVPLPKLLLVLSPVSSNC